MAFLDVPYNVAVRSIGGRGRTRHARIRHGLRRNVSRGICRVSWWTCSAIAAVYRETAPVHFVCCDWRHVTEIIEAGRLAYGETLNIVVWVKSNAGQGSFYRSQARVHRRIPCRQGSALEQYRARSARSFAFERVELPQV